MTQNAPPGQNAPHATHPHSGGGRPNKLAEETSPYLLQHQNNPVRWMPWGKEALALARADDKPILLSVGYAACHWCHVMAHESFEDPEVAALMNRLFVNIKVDREERPDLDTIYQSALHMMGEQGGWPLTMFLTPDAEPFWGGTYFPPTARFGRPAFRDVVQALADAYRREPDRIRKNVTALREGLGKLRHAAPGRPITTALADQAAARLLQEVDPQRGGIGGAPKFPQVPIFELIWRAGHRTGNTSCKQAVRTTLTEMSQGGIYDHLGGGFARYAVDDRWLVPHFEKMLYDNAQMIDLLTLAWLDGREPLYAARIEETVGWVLREMVTDGGGFASSLDADSEGEEGRFYVWTREEIEGLLGDDASEFCHWYDVTPDGNWEGKTILNRLGQQGLADPAIEARLARDREILFDARARRVPPGKDDKVLADWNGMMIAALAQAAAVFHRPEWLAAAERAFAFVTGRMMENGRLRHSWRAGRTNHPATLDDYAHLARAALALDEATDRPAYRNTADALVDTADRHYADPDGPGYFFAADDTPDLIVRTKSAADNATPSGNGILAGVLARLYFLTGNDDYRQRAAALVEAFSGGMQQNFFPLATLINSAELLDRAIQVVIRADPSDDAAKALKAAAYDVPLPNRTLQVVAPEADLPAAHPAHGKDMVDGRATAYLCEGPVCSLPLVTPAALRAALAGK